MISPLASQQRMGVIGASGRTGRLIVQQLLDAKQHVRAVQRSAALGAFADPAALLDIRLGDLRTDPPLPWMEGLSAVIFAAGGDTETEVAVDHHGAARCAEAATQAGVARFVLISAHGAHDPTSWGPQFESYLTAKAAGERAVRAAFPMATILRPGILTDGPATGHAILRNTQGPGEVPVSRADVAAAAVACALGDIAAGSTLEIVGSPEMGDPVAP